MISSTITTSATISCTCWYPPVPIMSTADCITPRNASVLEILRLTTWCAMWSTAPVFGVRLVGELDVVHQEHPLPRHEHVVEEHHRVHLVEP